MPATSGSPSSTTANVTAKSGAIPTVADVRDGPASRTASVKRICETPGPRIPASTNGQTAARSQSPTTAAARARRRARAATVRSAPTSGSSPRASAGAQRDRHRAEERGRAEREHDGVHQRPPRAGEPAQRAAAAGSASTIPASITRAARPADAAEPLRRAAARRTAPRTAPRA